MKTTGIFITSLQPKLFGSLFPIIFLLPQQDFIRIFGTIVKRNMTRLSTTSKSLHLCLVMLHLKLDCFFMLRPHVCKKLSQRSIDVLPLPC